MCVWKGTPLYNSSLGHRRRILHRLMLLGILLIISPNQEGTGRLMKIPISTTTTMSSSSVSPSTSRSPSSEPLKDNLVSESSSKDISSHSSLKDTEEGSTTQESTEERSEKDAESSELTTSGAAIPASETSSTPWQAIYSPQYSAYYFFNSETNETTWENPLAKASDSTTPNPGFENPTEPSTSAHAPAEGASNGTTLPSYDALQAAAIAQGIDPSLAHLDPSLAGPVASSSLGAYGAAAKFNARTGQFTRVDARDPSHLSEYERAKRMSEFYFDVNAWEKQRVQEQETEAAEGSEKKRKRPSKKDLEKFKEQKRQKKIAKTAWLRT
ncbi:hypothetical protein F5890DRAFT_279263 [Lentinula detonsa]|uniref:WW domain-containing protein n=1 Tax=Lentinula detonsa TaxID=2804962 RepID=A0AA38PWA7_9AGAR|nr:hypothetical protein F5890DRAFT_279263 [Lentinula detonsa]